MLYKVFSLLSSHNQGECVGKPEAETPEKCAAAGGTWTEFHNYLEITDKNQAQCTGNE